MTAEGILGATYAAGALFVGGWALGALELVAWVRKEPGWVKVFAVALIAIFWPLILMVDFAQKTDDEEPG